jgi:hypothetical protein
MYIAFTVDETGKKIRGRADEKVKDYDQYGKYWKWICKVTVQSVLNKF